MTDDQKESKRFVQYVHYDTIQCFFLSMDRRVKSLFWFIATIFVMSFMNIAALWYVYLHYIK